MLVLLLALACVACASGRSSGIRARFSSESGCPEDDVTVFSHSNSRFTASGCDSSQVYVCENLIASDVSSCSPERSAGTASPPGMRPTTPFDDPRRDHRQ